MSLPSGYTRIEYIQSSGTQYIETGFAPNQNTRVVCRFEILTASSTWRGVFGARDSGYSACFAIFASPDETFQTNTGTGSSSYVFGANVPVVGHHLVDVNKNVTTIDGVSYTHTPVVFQNTGTTIQLCAVNEAGSSSFHCDMKLYSFQLYDNGTLIRNFLPCVDTDGNVGLWDDVNSVFCGNAGSGVFTAGPVAKYARVECIESTGSQYINTRYNATSENYRVKCKFATVNNETGTVLFGGGASTDIITALLQSETQLKFYAGSSSVSGAAATFVRGELCELECYANSGTLTTSSNGVTRSGSISGSINKDYSLFVFANNVSGVASQFSNIRLYEFKIYDNGVLVRDYVPVVRQDGTAGLLDQVNEVFYANAGSGTFTVGPDLEWTELEYIESTGTQYVNTGVSIGPNNAANIRYTLDKVFLSTGADGTGYGASPYYNSMYVGNLGAFYYGNGRSDVSAGVSYDGTRKTISYSGEGKISISGLDDISFAFQAPESALNFLLFGYNQGTYGAPLHSARLYSFELHESDALVLDFVPALRDNGQIGLIDRVSGMFYGNSGTGVFIAGPEVVKEPEEPDVPDAPEKPDSPEVPAGLVCNGTTMGVAILSWGATNDRQSYRLYRDGVKVYEGDSLTYTDAGLEPGRQYTYSVSAFVDSEESEAVSIEVETKTEMWLIYDRTLRDLVERTDKSFYNALDMIRVGEAMEYLERHFYDVGISIFVSPKIDWNFSDVPSLAQAEKYLTDIKTVRSKLSEFRDASEIPGSMTGFNWDMANRIEAIMFDAEKLILDIIKSYRLICGRTISGVNCLP